MRVRLRWDESWERLGFEQGMGVGGGGEAVGVWKAVFGRLQRFRKAEGVVRLGSKWRRGACAKA